jgi:hypothetical protein
MILIKGMVSAMKSVFYVMCLLLVLLYVFAIAFTQLSAGTETLPDKFFGNVAHSMYSLMIYATFCDNMTYFMDDILAEHEVLFALALVFIALAALTVLNMLVGVLCEVVSAVAQEEKQEFLTLQVKERMEKVTRKLDTDTNMKISYKEFEQIIHDEEALKALEEVDVNPVGLVDFAELFFFDNGVQVELEFDRFMEMVLDLREENQAKVKDVLNLWMQVKNSTNTMITDIQDDMNNLEQKLEGKTTSLENQLSQALNDLAKITR